MDKIEKIIEILDNKNISSVEKEYLAEESKNDNEVKDFITFYNKFIKSLRSSTHLELEIIGEYILYKNGDVEASQYISNIKNKIENHLADCSNCRSEYEELNREYNSIDEFVGTKITEVKVKESVNLTSIFSRLKKSNNKVVFTAIMVLLIMYSGMMIVSSVTTPFYKKNIFHSEEKNNFITRGRTSVLFQKSLSALNKHDYDTAIKLLKEDIVKNSNENSIFYSYYVLGLTYLKSAERNFLGTIQSFDHAKIEYGIDNLFTANEKNNSGDYDNLKIDAHYYIAEGYLAVDELDSAAVHLHIVINKKGKFYKDAIEIIEAIEKN